jgi:hypothetical protein
VRHLFNDLANAMLRSYGKGTELAVVDEAFSAYGRVMAKIGAFEQFMRLALGEHEIRRAKAAGTSPNLQAFGKRVLKMDFGGLAQQVCDKFKFVPELKQAMKEAKGFRNHLAHDFWVSHFANLHSDRGVTIIVRQCKLLERQFDGLSNILVAGTGVNANLYAEWVASNANDELVFAGWESRLDLADRAMREAGEGLA